MQGVFAYTGAFGGRKMVWSCLGGYTYGFNGQMRDDEVYGEGNAYDFGARIYDPRLGRWLAVDPLFSKYPFVSPYQFVNNSPLIFIDPNGKEWINAYDAEVEKLGKQLLDNPNNKKLQRDLDKAKENQAIVNGIIGKLRDNDFALYNYVDKLTVEDPITGDKISVKVSVELDYLSGRSVTEDAKTSYKNENSFGAKKYIKYEGLEGEFPTTFAPLDNNDNVGFNIRIYSYLDDWSDNHLANEVGDVMFRMEYPNEAYKRGGDQNRISNGKIVLEDYLKEGGPGAYSKKVEQLYKQRKMSGEGKKKESNPYPLKNE